MINTSSLQSALDVFLRHEISALDLPIDPTDSMWERLEKDLKLTLGQISALRNYVKSRSIITPIATSSSLSSGGEVAVTISSPPTKCGRPRKIRHKKEGEEKLAATASAVVVLPNKAAPTLPIGKIILFFRYNIIKWHNNIGKIIPYSRQNSSSYNN